MTTPAPLSKRQALGFGGILLILAAYVLPAIAPDIAHAVTAHAPLWVAHFVVALVGGTCCLLGDYRRRCGVDAT